MSGKAVARLPSLGPGPRGRTVANNPLGKPGKPAPPAARRASASRPRAAPRPPTPPEADPVNKHAPLAACSPLRDPEGERKRISPTPPPPAQPRAGAPGRRANSGPPKMGGALGSLMAKPPRKSSGKGKGAPKPNAKQASLKRKAFEEAQAAAEAERLEAEREAEREVEEARIREQEEEFLRQRTDTIDEEGTKRTKLESREDRLWKDICLEAKGALEYITALRKRLEHELLVERTEAVLYRISEDMKRLEVDQDAERQCIGSTETGEWTQILEHALESLKASKEAYRIRFQLEDEEHMEVIKEEQSWRQGDEKAEAAAWEAMYSRFQSETVALDRWLTVTTVQIEKIVTNEHRQRLLLQQEQKEAWPSLTKYAAAERRVAKEKENARMTVEYAELMARKTRDGIIHLLSSEEEGRATVFDEQLNAWVLIAQANIESQLAAEDRATIREENEKSEGLRFQVGEGRARMDIKGEEEAEVYNIMYREQRERHRVLEKEQIALAVSKVGQMEQRARQDLVELHSKKFEQLKTSCQNHEYAILRRTNKDYLQVRMHERCKGAQDEVFETQQLARWDLCAEENGLWRVLMHREKLGDKEVTERLYRADMESLEDREWLNILAQAMESRLEIGHIEGLQQRLEQVLLDQVSHRKAIEDEEEMGASQLSVEQCRIVVEENRRQVKRRKEGTLTGTMASSMTSQSPAPEQPPSPDSSASSFGEEEDPSADSPTAALEPFPAQDQLPGKGQQWEEDEGTSGPSVQELRAARRLLEEEEELRHQFEVHV